MAKTQDIKKIPFENLVVNKEDNPRIDYDIAPIKKSLLENGLLQPMGVTRVEGSNDKYQLEYGYRRYYAIEEIRNETPGAFPTIMVVVNSGSKHASLARTLQENISRKDFTPAEEAEGYLRLALLGKPQEEIAAEMGVSQARVSNLLSIKTKAIPTVWDAFKQKELTAEAALNLASLPTDVQAQVLDDVRTAGTRKDARKIVKKAVEAQGPRKKQVGKTRPTAKNLAQFVSDASFDALSTANSKEERLFFNGVAAGLRVALGDFEFNSLKSSEIYADTSYGTSPEPETENAEVEVQTKTSRKRAAKVVQPTAP